MMSDDDDVFRQPPRQLSKKVDRPNTKDVPFSCKFCQASYTTKSNCTRHESNCKLNADKGLPKFRCQHCEKRFRRKSHLKDHLNICASKKGAKKGPPSFQCAYCNLQFPKKSNLKRHLIKCSLGRLPTTKTPCLVKNCTSSFYHRQRLIDHFSAAHQGVIAIKPKVTKTFSSIEEFNAWKEQEEENTFSYFSARRQTSDATQHFYCQHDGSGKLHSKGRKTSRRRNIPSIKVGHHCISKIKMTKIDDNIVEVVYYPTHSHLCKKEDQLHHPIPLAMSTFIDEKLKENIPPSVVYELVKERFLPKNNSVVNEARAGNLTRHLVLERGRRRRMTLRLDNDDAKSTYLLATQHIKQDKSVLIYKPFGADVVHGPQGINDLPDSKDLFMFGFQTDCQLALMKRHCSKILIVDETHGTNQYGYQLLTVMVVDENRRGWPVAHLITSKSDADTLKFFFQTLRERLDCKPSLISTVITDDDPALINAMKAGFSQTLTHLLCKWHIIKNLKENLRSKAPKTLFDEMFAEVKVILNAKDESLFLKLKNGFMNKYNSNPHAKEYMSYLNSYYWNRAEKWAMCYRNFPHANVDTTGHLESFHNRLKSNYLKRKPNKRCDDLINLLYDIAWDDERTRCKEAKIGFSVQPQKILERHQRGLLLEDNVIVEQTLESGLWEVRSGSGGGTYFIERQVQYCELEQCFSKCTKVECHSLCAHLYSCSCPDPHPLCKHIHKLQSFLYRNEPRVLIEEEFYNFETARSSDISEELNSNDNESVGEASTDHIRKKKIVLEKLKSHLAKFQEFMDQHAVNASEHCLIHMEATLSTLIPSWKPVESEIPVSHMEPAVSFASNEKLKTQISQLPVFKRPPKRRRIVDPSALAAKKQQAIESLSNYADEDEPAEGGSYDELAEGDSFDEI